MKLTIRNDDVSVQTNAAHLRQFSEICDKHGAKLIQAVTVAGVCLLKHKPFCYLSNEEIRMAGLGQTVFHNALLIDFLHERADKHGDVIAVHGLFHTHEPRIEELQLAKKLLENAGFTPTVFVPPFNEGSYPYEIGGMTTIGAGIENLEQLLRNGTPSGPLVYTHSWRFDPDCWRKFETVKWFVLEDLDRCLLRISHTLTS